MRDGTVPQGTLPEYEGEAAVSEELTEYTGRSNAEHLTFFVQYDAEGRGTLFWSDGPRFQSASPGDLTIALSTVSELLGTVLASP